MQFIGWKWEVNLWLGNLILGMVSLNFLAFSFLRNSLSLSSILWSSVSLRWGILTGVRFPAFLFATISPALTVLFDFWYMLLSFSMLPCFFLSRWWQLPSRRRFFLLPGALRSLHQPCCAVCKLAEGNAHISSCLFSENSFGFYAEWD